MHKCIGRQTGYNGLGRGGGVWDGGGGEVRLDRGLGDKDQDKDDN